MNTTGAAVTPHHVRADRSELRPVSGPSRAILDRAAALPDHKNFPTTDQLLAEFDRMHAEQPGLMSKRRVGTSRLGEPIYLYAIAGGARNHLIVGGVHPNEPIGSWTLVHLARLLLEDDDFRRSFDASWHMIPSIDPDGARLNEGWFSAPQDRRTYARSFYRPAPDEQVEWTFPVSYKDWYFDSALPETAALMRVLEDVKPDLYVGLHNSEMGGAYYYLSRHEPTLAQVLGTIPGRFGIALDTGEPESPANVTLAPGIYLSDTIAESYEYMESLGLDAVATVHGAGSTEYAARYGALSLIAEVPFWTHPAADDETPVDESYSELLERTAAALEEAGGELNGLLGSLEARALIDTPYRRAAKAFIPMISQRADTQRARARLADSNRPATRAEAFATDDFVTMSRLRNGGMLLRAAEAEVAAGIASRETVRLVEALRRRIDEWLAAARLSAIAEVRAIPIRSLVAIQLTSILATAEQLRGPEHSP